MRATAVWRRAMSDLRADPNVRKRRVTGTIQPRDELAVISNVSSLDNLGKNTDGPWTSMLMVLGTTTNGRQLWFTPLRSSL